jgi:chromosome segregation ATPase
MTNKSQSGFRIVPWRFSWMYFAGVFVIFFILNYSIVQFCAKRPLLGQEPNGESIKSIEAALIGQSQEVETLRHDIEQLRITSSSQRLTIQQMQRILDAAGGKLATLSGQLVKLRSSSDDVVRVVDNQEKSLSEIEKSLADVKVQVEKIRDTMSQSSSKP